MSLEELVNLEITSVSKKPQTISDSAAAVFVITQDDIRRSGATSIPEVLRLAPGVNVAHIDGNKWAITARGFNGRFANKLLVLMDGRSVYTPLFSGVYWDIQDTLLDDIERIEVIRGPGATLWGANAVNGVINIITKHSENTQGILAKGGYGSVEKGFAALRYGGALGDTANYRVYIKYFNRDGSDALSGGEAADDWNAFRGGFRFDGRLGSSDTLTVQGDAYSGAAGQTNQEFNFTFPNYPTITDEDTKFSGGNLLLRWERTLSDTSDLALQTYYDRTERNEKALAKESRDTMDLDFQHRFALGQRQEIVWGLGYRITWDNIEPNEPTIMINKRSQTDHLASLFVQDEITLKPDLLRLILGSKLENNDYTGLEIQPNARLIWTPNEEHSLWGAVSRAVRTPSRAEEDASIVVKLIPPDITNPLLTLITANGNNDFDSEELLAWELGYRFMPNPTFSLDLATFLNIYENLRTGEPQTPFVPTMAPHLVIPTRLDNKMKAKVWGFEAVADWKIKNWWRLQTVYSFLQEDLDYTSDSNDSGSIDLAEGTTPKHQVSLRSSMDLPRDIELDFWLRYADELESLGIDDYLTLDIRLGWQPRPGLELVLVGQNLLQNSHQEYSPEYQTLATEVPRGIYGQVVWHH
ncbi:MAG: TonB-dependent receptor [Desulfuromonadaceae bacterium]|nr:TonB-dependent receptor [Desulfuromonadaceae bacterium]